MNLVDLLKPLDSIFEKIQIPYLVIGGYAVAAWGEERATRDLDLFCAGNSSVIINAFKEAQLRFEHRTGDYDDPISEVIRIEMGCLTDPFEVDILIGIKNAPEGIFNRARAVNIEGLDIPITSPEDLIILKLLGGSARDLEDAKSIVQIQAKKLDIKLIKQLCPEYLKGVLDQLLN
jgi:predicted nucleotidyltransferase